MSPRAAFRTAEGWFRCATLGIAIGIGIGIAAIITLVVASRYVGATVDTDSDPDPDLDEALKPTSLEGSTLLGVTSSSPI